MDPPLAIPSRLHGIGKLQSLYAIRKLERPGAFLHMLWYLTQWLGRDAPRSHGHQDAYRSEHYKSDYKYKKKKNLLGELFDF